MWKAIAAFFKAWFTQKPAQIQLPKIPDGQVAPAPIGDGQIQPAPIIVIAPPKPANTRPDLARGDTGATVLELQHLLIAIGTTPGPADGMFGSQVEAAVRDAQAHFNMVVTGKVDSKLWQALDAATAHHETPAPTQPSVGDWKPTPFEVKSPRRLHPSLEGMMIAKLLEIAPNDFKKAYQAGNANMLVKLGGDALSAMRVREKTNNNDGVIVEMIQYTTHGSKGDAWCMDEQETLIAFAERMTGKVSRFPMTAGCADARARMPHDMIVSVNDCQPGDVWIWQHSGGSGHTGNFAGWITKGVSAYMNEGNTTAGKLGDKIVREGGGSYTTERSVGLNGDMTLRMVARPF